MNPKIIKIDNDEYVKRSDIQNYEPAERVDGLKYVLIRTYSAGVHIGYLKRREGEEVELVQARRIYCWYGAATLSQLAMEGVKNKSQSKISMPVNNIILTEAIEIIECTQAAKINIESVPEWKN